MTKKCGKGRQKEKAGGEGGWRRGTGMMGRKGGEGGMKGRWEGSAGREGKARRDLSIVGEHERGIKWSVFMECRE